MSKSKYQKYKSTLIGTIINIIGMSSIVVISSFNVYITSYIHIKQKWITMHYGLFLSPILTLCVTIANPIGGLIEKKIGFYYSLILSNIICLIGIFGLYLTQNIWLCYFFFLIIGFSCFSLNIPLKNITFYVPEKKGFINAVISVVLQISASIYGFLGEFIINKEGYSLKKKINSILIILLIIYQNFIIFQ
jgi:MFS family permease